MNSFCLIIYCWVCVTEAFNIDQLYFDKIDDNGAIPDGVVTSIIQDSQGFIWLGTMYGLIRYDGYEFRIFVNKSADPRSLGGNYIKALCLSKDGKLWIGTSSDGVSVFDPSTNLFSNYDHSPSNPKSLSHSRI